MSMMALSYAKLHSWMVLPIHRPIFGVNGFVRCSCVGFRKCTNIAKHPWSEHGVKDASRNEEWITERWKDELANIGVACGQASGFWALDVDPLKGGAESLAELEAKHGKLPDTVEAITGSGGRHILFAMPPAGVKIRNRVGFAPGLDTRSDGGYIIVAPSLHESGRRYEWEASSQPDETSIASAPDWLIELVLGAPGRELRGIEAFCEADLPELNYRIERARKYIAKVPGAIAGKGGHLQTWLVALVLARGLALPETVALEVLAAEYNPRCEPRWSLADLAHKVASATKDGRRPLGYLLNHPIGHPLPNGDPDFYEPDVERVAIVSEPPADKPRIVWITGPDLAVALPPTPWCVKDLQIGPGRPTMLQAYGGGGKTLIAQSLALAYASGGRVWGRFATGRGGHVRHFDYEQGRHATIRRYQRLAKGLEIELPPLGSKIGLCNFPDLYLTTVDAESVLLHELEQVELAIFDALRGATPGIDENDSKIRMYIDLLIRVSSKTEAAVVLIHHAGKAKDGHSDARTRGRGSSAIFDGCGCVFDITGEKDPRLVKQVKTPAEAEGGKIEEFYLVIEDIPDGDDPLGAVRVLAKSKEEIVPRRSGSKFDKLKEDMVTVVRDNAGISTLNALCARVTGGNKTVKMEAWHELVREGRIVQPGGEGSPFRVV